MGRAHEQDETPEPRRIHRLSLLEAALASVADGVIVVDATGRLVFMNEAGERLARRAPATTVPVEAQAGDFRLRYLDGQPIPPDETPLGRALRGESVADFLLILGTPDGADLYVSNTASPIRDAAERIVGAVSVFRDVTDRKRDEEALRRREEQFRLVVMNSPDVMFRQDRDLRYTWIHNPTAPFTAEWVLGKTDAELLDAAEATRLTEIKRRVLETGVGVREELRLSPGGVEHYYETAYEPLRDTEGSIVGVFGYSRDVTERKQAEEVLRESEARYRLLFTGMIAGFALHEIICDPQGRPVDYRFLDVNPAFEDLTGLRRERIVGRTVREVLPEIEDFWIETYGQVALTGRPSHFERYSREIGKHFEVVAYCPRPGQFAATFADVSERRRAEEERERFVGRIGELAEIAQRRAAELQGILDNMVDAVTVCDARGRITLISEPARRLAGFGGVVRVGVSLADLPSVLRLRHLDGRPFTAEELPLCRALAGEVIVHDDEVFTHPGTGHDVYLRASAAPIRDQRGDVVGAVAVSRDVTELSELDRLKDQFILVAAHELKTPVAIMKGYAQALLRTSEDLSAPRRKMLESIDRGADRIDRIVRDLLDVSRLQSGQLGLAKEPVDLSLLVEQTVDQITLTAAGSRLRLARAEPAIVRGDRDRLAQVLVNLLDNALRYSPSGGEVRVEVSVGDGEVVVSVSDSGVGIPREKQDRIFQRFYRAHTGTPYDYGGMGVGLYISKEIVSRHGGRMWFESEEGRGSTFFFSLPLVGGRAA